MLTHILSQHDYALALCPGFFRFYAHIGILHALEECGCLRPDTITGSSAGALVAAFLAAGMSPLEMAEAVLKIRREDVWDVGGLGGLLIGDLFEELINKHIPVHDFDESKIPLAVTAYDLWKFKTNLITTGSIATAAHASCTFPGLFQPVSIEGRPHIDGGVWDRNGMMALEECFRKAHHKKSKISQPSASNEIDRSIDIKQIVPDSKLIVNIVYDNDRTSRLPTNLQHCRLLTIVAENIPMVSPFTMNTMGPRAYNIAKAAMKRALLVSAHMLEFEPNHWVCYIDGDLVESLQDIPAINKIPLVIQPTTDSSAEEEPSSNLNIQHLPAPIEPSQESIDLNMEKLQSLHHFTKEEKQAFKDEIAEEVFTALVGEEFDKFAKCNEENDDEKEEEEEADETEEESEEQETEADETNTESSEPNNPVETQFIRDLNKTVDAVEDFMRIPSYAFINGSYYFYHAVNTGVGSVASTLQHCAPESNDNDTEIATPGKKRSLDSISEEVNKKSKL